MKEVILKYITVSILFILFMMCSCSEKDKYYFNGEIRYNYNYESEVINEDSLRAIRPQHSIFKFDIHNYKSQFINKDQDTMSYYYLSGPNVAVAHNQKLDQWRCDNYGTETDSILNFNVYDSKAKVLGKSCKIIEFESKFAINKYYVSNEIFLSPDIYKKHLAYNWSFYGEETGGALILKIEHQFRDHKMTGIAESIVHYEKYLKANELSAEALLQKCDN